MNVAIIHTYDPGASYASGIRTAISGFIGAAPAGWSIRVVGCTADPVARPIDVWTQVRVGDRDVEFLPILSAHPARRPRIPLSLRFCQRLLRRRRQIDLRGAHLIFHRLELAWPLLELPNPKLMFLHYAVPDQIFDSQSPSIWHHFPRLYLWLQRRILPRIDRVCSPTSDGIAWLSAHFPECADRIHFVPSFADPRHFKILPEPTRIAVREELVRQCEIDPDAPIGLYVGRFDPEKDPLLSLRAWHAMKEKRPAPVLTMIGEGILEDEMRAFVDASGMRDCVRFLGSLSAADVGRWMNAADVLVMTSRNEAMSMAMIEALRCGLPVVAPDLGEAGRLIDGPEAGRLIPGRSAEVFARAIEEVYEQPRDRAVCASRAAPYVAERVFAPIFSIIEHSARGADL